MKDSDGNWPEWIDNIITWVDEIIPEPIKNFVDDIVNYDKDNEDVDKVYESNYFSSYKGTLVIRHSDEYLSSWSIFGTIFLNHSIDDDTFQDRSDTLNHEYGHILQEKELGTKNYISAVALPSVVYNALSRESDILRRNYYNMPWEYDADRRGGVYRSDYAWWAERVSRFVIIVKSVGQLLQVGKKILAHLRLHLYTDNVTVVLHEVA